VTPPFFPFFTFGSSSSFFPFLILDSNFSVAPPQPKVSGGKAVLVFSPGFGHFPPSSPNFSGSRIIPFSPFLFELSIHLSLLFLSVFRGASFVSVTFFFFPLFSNPSVPPLTPQPFFFFLYHRSRSLQKTQQPFPPSFRQNLSSPVSKCRRSFFLSAQRQLGFPPAEPAPVSTLFFPPPPAFPPPFPSLPPSPFFDKCFSKYKGAL